jgi:CDP-diacylglycerol--serine O-phosphatidyltransferase
MKTKRRKKTRKKTRKGIFILPNLFTSASLFGGFYAVIAAIQGRFEAAAVAIIIAAVFDGIDGRIARFTKTNSYFGKEYDSLCDLVSFGMAPAILAFLWALKPFGRLGWLAGFMYVICGALRLARFNVEGNTVGDSHFKGLPIPAAACFISSMILFADSINFFAEKKDIISIIVIYVLSFLMVSSISYMSFKEFNIRNQKPFNVLVAIILVFIVIAYKPKILLFLILLSYILSGPALSLFLSRRKDYGEKELLIPGSMDNENGDDFREMNEQEISR